MWGKSDVELIYRYKSINHHIFTIAHRQNKMPMAVLLLIEM